MIAVRRGGATSRGHLLRPPRPPRRQPLASGRALFEYVQQPAPAADRRRLAGAPAGRRRRRRLPGLARPARRARVPLRAEPARGSRHPACRDTTLAPVCSRRQRGTGLLAGLALAALVLAPGGSAVILRQLPAPDRLLGDPRSDALGRDLPRHARRAGHASREAVIRTRFPASRPTATGSPFSPVISRTRSNPAGSRVAATGGKAIRLSPRGRAFLDEPLSSHDGKHVLAVGRSRNDRLAMFVLGRTDRARRLPGTGGRVPRVVAGRSPRRVRNRDRRLPASIRPRRAGCRRMGLARAGVEARLVAHRTGGAHRAGTHGARL